MRSRVACLVLLTALIASLASAAASASIAIVQPQQTKEHAFAHVITYDAAYGERNVLRVKTIGSTLVLHDSGAVITAGNACVSITVHEVRCTAAGLPVSLVAYGGDRNDDLRGSTGHDWLYGGRGDDVLDGGPSTDELDGDSGDDVLVGPDGNEFLIGGTGRDEVHLNAERPLGDADLLVGQTSNVDGPYRCDRYDTVFGARAGDELLGCRFVDYGGATTTAQPRFTGSAARMVLGCPGLGGGAVCTGRVQIGGRRVGSARFSIPGGAHRTVTVPLRHGRLTVRYGIVVSGTARSPSRARRLGASWTIRIPNG